MTRGFLPNTDAGLLAWSKNFLAHLLPDPQSLGITVALADAYQLLHDRYAAAYADAANLGTRSRAIVSEKNDCRAALKSEARRLVSIIRGQRQVSDAERIQLGITVRASGSSKIGAPDSPPTMWIAGVNGRRVTIRLSDSKVSGRRKPQNVLGATLFRHIGPNPPRDIAEWTFIRSAGKTKIDVDLPGDLAPGTVVHFAAFWFNAKGDAGPAATPVQMHVQFGGAPFNTPRLAHAA